MASLDPEAFERAARAIREISASSQGGKAMELAKQQEITKQNEYVAAAENARAQTAALAVEQTRVREEEHRKTQHEASRNSAELARYTDSLRREQQAKQHELTRQANAELVQLQEVSHDRQLAATRATEAAVAKLRTEAKQHEAEIERETLRARALAEAEGRSIESRQSEDVNTRLLQARLKGDAARAVEVARTALASLFSGTVALLGDPPRLAAGAAALAAVAAGVYASREAARVGGAVALRLLTTPPLVRETSRRAPWRRGAGWSSESAAAGGAAGGAGFGDVVLAPALAERVRSLAVATANTRRHAAPFRHMLFYGPPGTGKTMAAKQLAAQSGLDYAVLSGGDVEPLGDKAVTELHALFDWAARTPRGMLLFIDEADAFLCRRDRVGLSEPLRAALNAVLYRTGGQQRDFALVLATNRPGDLDAAVADRLDEALEFPLPGADERLRLLAMYLRVYVEHPGEGGAAAGAQPGVGGGWLAGLWRRVFGPKQAAIAVQGVDTDVLREAARATQGFSGRELAKLMASVQGEVYARSDATLTADVFRRVVAYKVAEHARRAAVLGDAAQGKAAPAGH